MNSDWAREHLQIIRTLMERSAVYRRALAPMTLAAGAVGLAAATVGWLLPVAGPRAFVVYWLVVALVAGILALLLVRWQAVRDQEPFWSPPTRRVAQAAVPPLFAGLVFGVAAWLRAPAGSAAEAASSVLVMGWLPCAWIICYGCAVHAAGFFMPRGMRLFGGILVLLGAGLGLFGLPETPGARFAHGVMGACFGGLHLAYGLYLRWTEPRAPVA